MDKTAGFYPHLSSLWNKACHQAYLWASLQHGSAAFAFITIDLRSDTVLTVSVVHFGRFPFVLQNQLPFPDFKLGLFASLGPLTCPHPSGRSFSADHVVFSNKSIKATSSAVAWKIHARQDARTLAEIFVAVFEVDVEAFGRLIRQGIRQALFQRKERCG